MNSENWNLKAAWQFHQGTKHPGGFLLAAGHRFGPGDMPPLYKKYLGLEVIPLPLDREAQSIPALNAISSQVQPDGQTHVPTLETLARLLFYSAGVTKVLTIPGFGDMHFRAAACTGALFHIELYLVCGDLPGLPAGVYHFDPLGLSLHRMRSGDYRRILVEASGNAPGMEQAPVVLLYSDVFFRNAVKYQARAYRHSFWDSGTILANSLAVCTGLDLPAQVVTGFADHLVNHLLGLDGSSEAVLEMMAVGADQPLAPDVPSLDDLYLETEPSLTRDKEFPAIGVMHQASSLDEPPQVAAWRAQILSGEANSTPAAQVGMALNPPAAETLPMDAIERVILRRGSSRRFVQQAIPVTELAAILKPSTRGIPFDFSGRLNQIYVIVHAVEGLSPGTYVYHPETVKLEPLEAGSFRGEAGHLALGQALAANASANVYFMVDLPGTLQRFGNRGYRLAQLEAAVMAGKMYLAAYALRRGATGLTFNDDQVTTFFSPHAQGKSVMFLIAIGIPAKRS